MLLGAMLSRQWSCLAWIAVVVLACSRAGSDTLTQTISSGDTPTRRDSDAIVHVLDPDHLTVTQPIEHGDMKAGAPKFVQVDVAEVANPHLRSLIFEVFHQRNDQQSTHLGDFTLYPSDRPGTFLVATQGRVANEGAIVLTLTSPDGIRHGDQLRVGVRRIRFVDR